MSEYTSYEELHPPLEIVDGLSGKSARWQREKVSGDAIPADLPEGSTHLALLWASDEIALVAPPPQVPCRGRLVEQSIQSIPRK